jgi:hypothetical protein
MANDNEAKRLANWKTASESYLARLEEMVAELRDKTETVPVTPVLKGLAKTCVEIERAAQSFRFEVTQAVNSAPQPPSE